MYRDNVDRHSVDNIVSYKIYVTKSIDCLLTFSPIDEKLVTKIISNFKTSHNGSNDQLSNIVVKLIFSHIVKRLPRTINTSLYWYFSR